MRRQLVLFAGLLLLLQIADVCNGRAMSKEDELAALAKRLRELVLDKKDQNEAQLSDEHYRSQADFESSVDKEFDISRYESRDGGLTQQQKDKVIELHNRLRKGEDSSNMYSLKYNDNLARLAQQWADRCAWGHRPHGSFNPKDYGFANVGENIWAWSDDSKVIPDQPIQDWFDEKKYYNYDSGSCAKEPCGHYTAVVWHNTKEVGCGLRKCGTLQNAGMSNANFFVCNYGPGGNFQGEKPYKKGTPCTQCSSGQFFCKNGMCDDGCSQGGGGCECKAKCGNGSPTSDCKCKCNAGASGVDCSDRCENKNPQCGANPGWPEMFCHDKNIFGGMMYDTVNTQCPKMCKKCSAKKREDEEVEWLETLKDRMAEDKK